MVPELAGLSWNHAKCGPTASFTQLTCADCLQFCSRSHPHLQYKKHISNAGIEPLEKIDYSGETQSIRPCAEEKNAAILGVINDAAAAYKGVIPADRWHDPYMSMDELKAEIAAGVRFTGYSVDGRLVGVMGIQSVLNVRLIRHAYVLSIFQGRGIGSALIRHLLGSGTSPILIGTWAAASWAIGFYEGHGFTLVPQKAIAPLLKVYWDVPEQQIATSVVLAVPALTIDGAARLVAGAFQP